MKEKLFKIKKEWGQSCFFQSVFLNISVLCLFLLFFKPTLKSDDYYLGEIIYGSVSGVYDIHLVYNNILLGYLTKFLLYLFPEVAWYTVLQIICVFYAFTLLTYWILKKNFSKYSIIFGLIILSIFGYECYIRITFTKTAAVLLAVGLICLFWSMGEHKKRMGVCIASFFCIFLGLLYRKAVLNSVFAILAGIIFMKVIFAVSERKIEKAFRMVFMFGMLLFSIFITNMILTKFNHYVYMQDKEWSQYFENNKLKSQIVDYTTNNYEDYEEEYLEIGITANDLSLIYSNDLYDAEYLPKEKIEKIVTLANKGKDKSFFKEVFRIGNIVDYLRTVPISYLKTFCFSAYIILTVFGFLLSNRKRFVFLWCYSIILMLGENYYLFLKGRVLQPHVDVGIIFSACLLLLFGIKSDYKQIKYETQKKYSVLMLFLVIFNILINSYDSLSAPYFWDYGSENACNPKKSREIMDILTEDKENLYVTTSKESVYSKWSFDTLEVIPKGYFGNIYSLGSALWPSQKVPLEKYNVKNVYKELVNSEHIYFFVSDDLEESGIHGIQTYINEHYDDNAKMVKVKEFQSMNVYRCISNELIVQELPYGTGSVKSDLKILTDGNSVYIDGYCYVEDCNSYNQDMYIEILDSETKRKFYYNTLQTENPDIKDNMNGCFSKVEAYLEAQEYWSEEDEVSILLHADGYSYRIPLEME